MKHLSIDPSQNEPATRDFPQDRALSTSLPDAKETKVHPRNAGKENASLFFVGTATTILDHFDQEVEASLRRNLPIITTPHAKKHLTTKGDGDAFTAVYDLDFFDEILVDIDNVMSSGKGKPAIKVVGMPGKHVPPGVLGKLNDLLDAVITNAPGLRFSRITNAFFKGPTDQWLDA
ncbi:MAG: hypothetical protein Q9214_004253 [Letrouitia sp. 1 TL-2023]